jgi:hypothetical protein
MLRHGLVVESGREFIDWSRSGRRTRFLPALHASLKARMPYSSGHDLSHESLLYTVLYCFIMVLIR